MYAVPGERTVAARPQHLKPDCASSVRLRSLARWMRAKRLLLSPGETMATR